MYGKISHISRLFFFILYKKLLLKQEAIKQIVIIVPFTDMPSFLDIKHSQYG